MTRILIAEDDPEIAMLERDYLEMEGYEVSTADNGQQAVTQALNGEYDLILLDLMLPPPAPSLWTRSGGLAWGRTTTFPSPLTRRSWWPG